MDFETALAGMVSPDSFVTVSSFMDKSRQISVNDAELIDWHEKHDNCHFRREAMLVLSGSTLQKLEGRYYDCQPGTLFLIDRNEHHGNNYDLWSYGMHVWLYILPEAVICNVYHGAGGKFTAVRSCLYRSPQEMIALHNVWDRIKERKPADIAELLARIRLLYCGVYRYLLNPKSSVRQSSTMEMLSQYLFENSGRDSSISQLAGFTGYSRQHLMRKFRQKFGCTIGEYIDQIRCEKLRELRGTVSVKELADMLGFDSSSAFCHWRKKQSSVSGRGR